ncbi:intermembrane transport protein PqiB [Amaricoccus tamworthensis]|uniref:PqiB family protein n=1 Tax=Amaricoccus tamworthensis TaxID=57002 RepID=UPI003C7D4FF1
MNDTTPSEPVIEAPKRRWLPKFSLTWVIPLAALALSLSVGWRTYNERGPLITILFESASGIKPLETELRFRDMTVGTVETVEFTDDLSEVAVGVRLDKEVAEFVDDGAEFWLVSARVGPAGISGLETVLSGAYIEASWDHIKGPRQSAFTALEKPKLTAVDEVGTPITIRAPDGGSIAVGAPVLFKQIPVGRIESVELDESGDVIISAFVDAPHDLRLTSYSRFWNASGFSIELGATGASFNVESLAALVQGGVSFDTLTSGGELIEPNHEFSLYQSEREARTSVVSEVEQDDPVRLTAVFDGSLAGLEAGAAVKFRGLRVGEVTGLNARVTETEEGPSVVLETAFYILPSRIGFIDEEGSYEQTLDLLESAVSRGLRARLAGSGLLSQKLEIELIEATDAPEAEFDRTSEPWPTVPTVETETADIVTSAEGIMTRVSNLPVEEIMASVATLLNNVNTLIESDEIQSAPENIGLMIADLREITSGDDLQNAPADVAAILASVREIVDQVAEQELAGKLAVAVENASAAISQFDQTMEQNLPGLMSEIEGLTSRVADLPLEDLVASATDLVGSVDAVVRSDDVANLPIEVTAAVSEVRMILEEIRTGGALDNANATLLSVRTLTEEIAAARITESLDRIVVETENTLANISVASNDMPELVNSLTDLSRRASELPLDELVASTTALIETFDALVGSEEFAMLPSSLAGALTELRAVMADLREGGAVENLNTTLASADEAAAAITQAANDLPALVASFNQVARRADAALATLGPDSEINRETLILLREVRDAARSVNNLAVALERRPNSVLFGR